MTWRTDERDVEVLGNEFHLALDERLCAVPACNACLVGHNDHAETLTHITHQHHDHDGRDTCLRRHQRTSAISSRNFRGTTVLQ